jgi:cytochrome P450
MVPRKYERELVLWGQTIRRGDDLRLCITAANNDPAVFEQPRRFDPSRGNSHLAFGHGEHFCLGSHMARRVLETGLKTLLQGFPDLVLIKERPVQICGGVLRGPATVWAKPGP